MPPQKDDIFQTITFRVEIYLQIRQLVNHLFNHLKAAAPKVGIGDIDAGLGENVMGTGGAAVAQNFAEFGDEGRAFLFVLAVKR